MLADDLSGRAMRYEVFSLVAVLMLVLPARADEVVVTGTRSIFHIEAPSTVDLPRQGIGKLRAVLTLSVGSSDSATLEVENICQVKLWAVLARPGRWSSYRKDEGQSTRVAFDPAVTTIENHTRCPKGGIPLKRRLRTNEAQTLTVDIPLNASLYEDGKTYELYVSWWGQGASAEFLVRKIN